MYSSTGTHVSDLNISLSFHYFRSKFRMKGDGDAFMTIPDPVFKVIHKNARAENDTEPPRFEKPDPKILQQ